MKKFNKVLAMFLALVTVIAMLPISVFAEEWAKVDAKNDGDSTTVTVTVNAGKLADILTSNGVSKDTITEILKGVSFDVGALKQAITLEELFEIVPKDVFVNHFDAEALASKLDLNEMKGYIEDYAKLLEGCDLTKLPDFIPAGTDLSTIFVFSILMDYVEFEDAKDYLKDEELKTLMTERLTDSKIIEKFVNDIGTDVLTDVVMVSKLLEDGVVSLNKEIIPVKGLKSLFDFTNPKLADELLAADIFNLPRLETLMKSLSNAKDYFDTDKVKALINIDDYVGDFDYDAFNIDYSVFVEDDINKAMLDPADYTINPDLSVSLSDVGKEHIRKNPSLYLSAAGKAKLEAQVSIDDVYPQINVDKLIADVGIKSLVTCMKVEQAIEIDGLDDCVVYAELADYLGGYSAIINNEKIDVNFDKIDWSGMSAVKDISVYVDLDKLFDAQLVKRSVLFEAAGGEDKLLDCVDTNALFKDSALLKKVINAINSDPTVEITDAVNVDAFLNAVTDKVALVRFIGVKNLMAQISQDELIKIARDVGNIFSYITEKKALVKDIINEAYWSIDELSLNGQIFATENPDTATLTLDLKTLLKALAQTIPSLADIANAENGKFFSTTVGMVYQGKNATTSTSKNVTFEFVLEGDLSRLQAAAGRLDELLRKFIDFSINKDGDIYLGLNFPQVATPEVLSVIYKKAVNTDLLSDELKVKLLNASHTEFVGFIDTLELDDFIEILEAVDLNALYDVLTSVSYVETVMEKLSARTGIALENITLDMMKDELLSIPSADRICEIIKNRTGRDVMAILEAAANRFDNLTERQRIEKMLELVSNRLNYDLTSISVADVLDRASDVPISERIAELVSNRVGVDVMAVLESHTVQELYDAAVARVATKVDAFEKVKGYAFLILDYLPDEIANVRIADAYKGEGNFGGVYTADVNYKNLIVKVVNKLVARFDLPIEERLLNAVYNRIPNGTLTGKVNISNVHVTNIREIVYMNREGTEELFRAFLPAGADLTVFQNNLDLVGYEFTGWSDAQGNAVTTMPNNDIVVYADRASIEVSLYDTDGKTLLTKVYVYKGATINSALVGSILDMVTLPAVNVHLHNDFHLLWKYTNAEGAVVDGLDLATAKFTEDISLVAYATPDYFLHIDGYDYLLTFENGHYTLTVDAVLLETNNITFILSRDEVLRRFAQDTGYKSITFAFAKDGLLGTQIKLFTLSRELLLQLYNATQVGDEVFITYDKLVASAANNPMYQNLDGASFFDFSFEVLRAGQTETATLELGNFAGDLTIQLPYAGTVTNDPTGDSKTFVYILTETAREQVEVTVTNNRVEFVAPHFSEYVINTEYRIYQKFLFDATNAPVPGNNYLEGLSEYYPQGATVTIKPVFDTKYDFDRIEVSAGTLSADGTTLTTPAAGQAVTVTVYLTAGQFHVYYIVNGATYKDVAYRDVSEFTALDIATVIADADVTVPTGYTKTGAAWVGYDATKLGVEDLYVVATWKPIEYTVNFVSEEANSTQPVTFTIENYKNFVAPAVPTVAGMAGQWAEYSLEELIASTETTLTVKAIYTPTTYAIVVKYLINGSDAVVQAVPGKTATIPEYTIRNYTYTITAVDEDGNEISVTGWKFLMPSATVYVTVAYEPVAMNYSINGTAYAGKFGDTVAVDVNLAAGEVLASISDVCNYVGLTKNDTTTTLHYQFVLENDQTAVVYTIAKNALSALRIFNGSIFTGSGYPVSENENATFKSWATGVAGFNFAVFEYHKTVSLLWLWILLAIALIIFLIGLIYNLHVNGKMRTSFLTRFAVWVVTLFFKLCLAVAALGMKIGSLFGKEETPAAYGVEEAPAEAPAEEAAEETEPKQDDNQN